MDQVAAECVSLPESEANTGLLEGALEALESLHVWKAQRGLLGRAGSRAYVEGPLGLGEGLVQDMLGVGQAGEGSPQVGQLSVQVDNIMSHYVCNLISDTSHPYLTPPPPDPPPP